MSINFKPVLAMYDVRGKQAFIFRTNKLKEIVGGSGIIRDIFKDYLFPAAISYRNSLEEMISDKNKEAIYTYSLTSDPVELFSSDAFKERMKGKQFLGEVIYEGGGNFLVLYKNEEVFVEINKIFTKELLKEIGSIHVLATCVEVSDDFNNYKKDNDSLYKKHECIEAAESKVRLVNGIPFVQVDPLTSMPIVKKASINGAKVDFTRESAAKKKKYEELVKENPNLYGEKILDNIVKDKGTDSLLAVIFIDGNSMGAKIQNLFKDEMQGEIGTKYEIRVNKLRDFSRDIQKHYVDERKIAIEEAILEKSGEKRQRSIVFAGDEMSFIVKAEDALTAIEAYFDGLTDGRSSCAGVAIFHSHAPYAEAYKIAEECCETGKKRMKENKESDVCYVDFQYCRSGLGMDLETMRKRETGDLISKPWMIKDNRKDSSFAENTPVTLDYIKTSIVGPLNLLDSRTNVKSLIQVAERSLLDFDMEMERIYAHQKEEIQNNKTVKNLFIKMKGEERRRMVYDVVNVYDLWFSKGKEEKSNE